MYVRRSQMISRVGSVCDSCQCSAIDQLSEPRASIVHVCRRVSLCAQPTGGGLSRGIVAERERGGHTKLRTGPEPQNLVKTRVDVYMSLSELTPFLP